MIIQVTGYRFNHKGNRDTYFFAKKIEHWADKPFSTNIAWNYIVKVALMGYQDVRATIY